MQDIISRCWHQEAGKRPSAEDLPEQLKALQADIDAMDASNHRKVVPFTDGSEDGSDKQGCCAMC